jgi:hypothetical protein
MPAVAVNHHTEQTSDLTGRDEAYRMVAELLVGFRRIVGRGLQRVFGDDWFASGCPPAVRDRILARQTAEQGIDRFAAGSDDPFAQATFADLADILESVDELALLLRPLAASPDGLIANLRSLEELRTKIAAIRRVSEQEQLVLAEMHLRLREKLAGARRKSKDEAPPTADEAIAAQAAETPAETQSAQRPRVDAEPPGAGLDEQVADSSRAAAEPKAPVAEKPAARQRDLTAVAAPEEQPRPARSVYDPVGAAVLDGAPTPVGLVRLEEEDLAVLRDLRREIIAAAEAAYAQSDEIGMEVWGQAWESGWYSRKLERYGLGEVATFYAVMEQYLEQRRAGCEGATLRTFLADRELAKVLLRLRELFLRLKV